MLQIRRLLFGAALAVAAARAHAQSSTTLDDLAEPGHRAADTMAALAKPMKRMGGAYASVVSAPPWPVPPGASGYVVSLSPDETGVIVNGNALGESFGLVVPAGYDPASPPPLVVAWHGYGSSQNQVFFATTLAAEANERGWLVLAPLGIADNTFSWLPGQQAVDKTIDWLAAHYPFDASRVYGVGFSMGGDCIFNYAARRTSNIGIRFAALAAVCGSFDNVRTYSSDPSVQALMQSLFGGDPFDSLYTFQYERTSAERVIGGAALEGHSLARSLARTPVYLAWSTDDGMVPYVPGVNAALVDYLTSLGNTPVVKTVSGLPIPHSWAALDVADCCSFFEGKSLVAHPADFTVLADADGEYNGVNVTNTGTGHGVFRRFDATASAAANKMTLLHTQNVGSLAFRLGDFGLDAASDWKVTSQPSDATTDVIRVLDAKNPPAHVRRDGKVIYTWKFDPSGSLEFTAPADFHLYQVAVADYELSLSRIPVANECGIAWLHVDGLSDGESYQVFTSLGPGFYGLSDLDPADPRFLLLDPTSLSVAAAGSSAPAAIQVTVPATAALVGAAVRFQAVSTPGSASSIPFAVGKISNPVDVPTALDAPPVIPFRAGDVLAGAVDAPGEHDDASFSALAGETLTLEIKAPAGDLAPSVELRTVAGDLAAAISIKASSKAAKKTIKVPSSGAYVLRVFGASGSTGAYSIKTTAKLPKGSGAQHKVFAAPKNGGAVEMTAALLADAGFDALIAPAGKAPIAGALSVTLLAPNGSPVDLAGHVQNGPNGSIHVSGLTASAAGTYRLRVSGFAPKDKISITAVPAQPAGGAAVMLQ